MATQAMGLNEVVRKGRVGHSPTSGQEPGKDSRAGGGAGCGQNGTRMRAKCNDSLFDVD